MASKFEDPLFIKSIEKGFTIIELFERVENDLSLSEIAKATGYGISGTQRLLFTLEKLGYLEKSQQTKRYTPGIKSLTIGFEYDRLGRIKRASLKVIEALATLGQGDIFLMAFNKSNLVNVMHIPRKNICGEITTPGDPCNLIYSL